MAYMYILFREPPTTIVVKRWPLTICSWSVVLQESCDKNYTADSLNAVFEIAPEACIAEFLQEVGFFNLIWMIRSCMQSLTWIIFELRQ